MTADRPSPASLDGLTPTAAAAFWLERLQRDGEDGRETAFRQWLGSSEANRVAWDRAQDLWDLFEEPEADDVMESMRREALALRGRQAAPVAGWYAAAAVAAVVVVGVLISNSARERRNPAPAQIASAEQPDLRRFGKADYETAVGQRVTVRLADASKVELDTNSAIDVAYKDGLRLVRLVRGRAFFDVTHDASRPFRVAAGGRVISVLGTRFEVSLDADQTRVRLEKGSVAVSRGNDPRNAPGGDVKLLAPGQQLIARPGRADELSTPAADAASDGRREVIQFDNTALSEAVGALNRYTKDQLVITDPKVGALRISGAFRPGDTERFSQTLTALYPVRMVRLGDGRVEIAFRPRPYPKGK